MKHRELIISENRDANANHMVNTIINNISERSMLIGLGILGTTMVAVVCAVCFSDSELKIDKTGLLISKRYEKYDRDPLPREDTEEHSWMSHRTGLVTHC